MYYRLKNGYNIAEFVWFGIKNNVYGTKFRPLVRKVLERKKWLYYAKYIVLQSRIG